MSDNKIREQLETEKRLAITLREFGYTVLVWSGVVAALTLAGALMCLVYYGVPALKAWRQSSDATARAIPANIGKLSKAIDQITSDKNGLPSVLQHVDSTAANLDELSGQFKDDLHARMADLGRSQSELNLTLAQAREDLVSLQGLTDINGTVSSSSKIDRTRSN